MRADWPRHELRRKDAVEWQFLESEAAIVRASALERRSPILQRTTQLVGN
jgi:hypothetical protein